METNFLYFIRIRRKKYLYVGEDMFTFKTDKPFELFNNEERFNFKEINIISLIIHIRDSEDENNESENEFEIDEDEVEEKEIYNGTNEMVKIFNQKCVICLDKDTIYSFRNCGLLCLCGNCFDSKITKCVVCRC